MTKRNDWKILKATTEEIFKNAVIDYKHTWGFQIQTRTKWNKGLPIEKIQAIEEYFKFILPVDYVEMLQVINGFDTPHIAVNPDITEEYEYQRRCYKYPDDIENTKWLIEEAKKYIEYATEALHEHGFNNDVIEGFVPLYGHRALAVLKDKTKSPVLSIWGDDIIVYGNTLVDYWYKELAIPHKYNESKNQELK